MPSACLHGEQQCSNMYCSCLLQDYSVEHVSVEELCQTNEKEQNPKPKYLGNLIKSLSDNSFVFGRIIPGNFPFEVICSHQGVEPSSMT